LYIIVAWSFVVAIGVEVYKRYNSGSAANAGSAAPGGGSSTSSDKEEAEELESAAESSDTPNVDNSNGVTKDLELSSLTPGKLHCFPEASDSPVLELILSNGRPILSSSSTGENTCWKRSKPIDDGVETGEIATTSPSDVALLDLVSADRPGVFYCGADKLLEAIQKCVKVGQRERKRELKISSPATRCKITDCVYYKESFEM